jgi:thiamine-monophosphate kinase
MRTLAVSHFEHNMPDKLCFRTEAEFVAWLQRRTAWRAPGLRLGIGDDAALVEVRPGRELILTTDMSIEGVHFRPDLHSPQAVGHRALARSLSDIAAMGGRPRYALISLAVSRHMSRAWMEGFFHGLLSLARRFGVAVIGGDTAIVRGASTIDVVVAGEAPCGKALHRSGARAGDHVFVSGPLGLAALGLRLLQSPARRGTILEGDTPRRSHLQSHGGGSGAASAIRAHLFPQPQCALGQFLSEQELATALIDVSDGLSIDLNRLCDASKVGARVFAERIPLSQQDKPRGRTSASSLLSPETADALELALHGGEDYQLLFTVSPARKPTIPHRFGKLPLNCIGEIQASRAIQLITLDGKSHPLEPRGYDHFARRWTKRVPG